MTKKSRSNLVYWMFIGAAGAAGGGFLIGKNATDSFKPQPPAMWLMYALAGILILGAIIVLAAGSTTPSSGEAAQTPKPALVPGWYDDPDTPTRLRYWNGSEWTSKTADKAPPP